MTTHLGIERLEDRRLMATFTVSSLDDAGPGTLRQAILDANALTGADEVDLSAVAGTIAVTSGEFAITEALSIVGPGDEVLTIDAQQASRIFNVNFLKGDVSIAGLTLINGKTTADDQGGGAVYSNTFGNLTFTDCTLRGNVTVGKRSTGGAIRSQWHLFLVDCLVENNHTLGDDADGGGVYARGIQASLTRTMVVGNFTAGYSAPGGGVWALSLLNVVDSNVKQNRTKGDASEGGGVRAGTLTMTTSALFQNGTEGRNASGGGAHANSATISASGIVDNFTLGHSSTGGGLDAANFSITESFVLDNTTNSDFASGGGIGGGTGTGTITGSTISGNRTLGASSPGGGVRFTGTLVMTGVAVTSNSTAGDRSSGGGVRSDNNTTIVDSIILNNTIGGGYSYGGGVFLRGAATITGSQISDNKTTGLRGFGGGVTTTGSLTLDRSTVHGNSTAGQDANGGGIHALGALTVRESTVSGNSTSGGNADGGGLVVFARAELEQATVSGNRTEGANSSGGGIAAGSDAQVTLSRSTLTENRTSQVSSRGGGIMSVGLYLGIDGSIVAGNQAQINPDIYSDYAINAEWSLIEETGLALIGSNNIIGVSAELLPLANNGGPTKTHALSPSSPALDAGDPADASSPAYDQRGFAFARIVGGRIDMGAFEAGAVSADFDRNGRVDGDDLLAWQRGLGGAATHAAGDANVDGVIDGGDLEVWRDQHGTVSAAAVATLAASSAATGDGAMAAVALSSRGMSASLVDAAMAYVGELAAAADDDFAAISRRRRMRWAG